MYNYDYKREYQLVLETTILVKSYTKYVSLLVLLFFLYCELNSCHRLEMEE